MRASAGYVTKEIGYDLKPYPRHRFYEFWLEWRGSELLTEVLNGEFNTIKVIELEAINSRYKKATH